MSLSHRWPKLEDFYHLDVTGHCENWYKIKSTGRYFWRIFCWIVSCAMLSLECSLYHEFLISESVLLYSKSSTWLVSHYIQVFPLMLLLSFKTVSEQSEKSAWLTHETKGKRSIKWRSVSLKEKESRTTGGIQLGFIWALCKDQMWTGIPIVLGRT